MKHGSREVSSSQGKGRSAAIAHAYGFGPRTALPLLSVSSPPRALHEDRSGAPAVSNGEEGLMVDTLGRGVRLNSDPEYQTPSHVGTRQENMEWHIRQVMDYLGLPDSQHFHETPRRFLSVLQEYTQGIDLDALLKQGFGDDEEPDAAHNKKTQVIQVPVPFMGICAHHLLPFFGSAAVGYLPTERVVGISKLARLVYAAGHLAPSTQEVISNAIADTLFNNEHIKPRGVAVITSALHGCMAVRGTRTPDARTLVTVIRGDYEENPGLENKFTTIAMAGLE